MGSEAEACRHCLHCLMERKLLMHSIVAKETIKMPISYMGVAAAAFSSVYSTRPQFVQTPTYFCHSWLTVNE